jgi:methylase of polypeptide subunit release factors
VLEVGTGNGRLVAGYAHVARTVLGIDPDPEALQAAAATARAAGWGHVRFAVAAAQELDAGRRRYDLAVLAWSL